MPGKGRANAETIAGLRARVEALTQALDDAGLGAKERKDRPGMTVRELLAELERVSPRLRECRVAIDLGGELIAEVSGIKYGDDGANDMYVEIDFKSVRMRRST